MFVYLGTTSLGAILSFGISYSVAFQKMQLFLEFKKYYSSSQTVTAMIDKCSDGIMVYTWSSEDKDLLGVAKSGQESIPIGEEKCPF